MLLRNPDYYEYKCIFGKLTKFYPNIGTDVDKRVQGSKYYYFTIYHTIPGIKDPIPFVCYEIKGSKLIQARSLIVLANKLSIKIAEFEDCAYDTPRISTQSNTPKTDSNN